MDVLYEGATSRFFADESVLVGLIGEPTAREPEDMEATLQRMLDRHGSGFALLLSLPTDLPPPPREVRDGLGEAFGKYRGHVNWLGGLIPGRSAKSVVLRTAFRGIMLFGRLGCPVEVFSSRDDAVKALGKNVQARSAAFNAEAWSAVLNNV